MSKFNFTDTVKRAIAEQHDRITELEAENAKLEAINKKLRELVALMRVHDRVPSISEGNDLGRWVAESAEIERLIGELDAEVTE